MGHIDVKGLERATTGLPIDSVLVKNCRICALANIKRLKFPRKASNRADRALFRIHCDICGPLPVGYGGFKYFITFIDDCYRYISIYFLKSRDEAVKCFHEFRAAAEKFLGYSIIFLRVDNAPELIRGQFEDYCKSHGITYERTVPDAHQQNGVAERTNQIIECMTRAMLVDCGLTVWFCSLATRVSGHIKNRGPHASLDAGRTPFQGWFKRKPDLAHLRPFGSLVTARKTDSTAQMKFASRGEEGRFVGYARDSKGYLIWFPHSRTVRPRRDVEFHGFPSFLPSPPLSDILWEDVPTELEPHFHDPESRIALEAPSGPGDELSTPASTQNPAFERNESSSETLLSSVSKQNSAS